MGLKEGFPETSTRNGPSMQMPDTGTLVLQKCEIVSKEGQGRIKPDREFPTVRRDFQSGRHAHP